MRDENDDYITVAELSKRIHYAVQSIYNMISNGTFVEYVHYFKPTPKKILLYWPAVKAWIERDHNDGTPNAAPVPQSWIRV
ncbi:MAG: hypothetical protein ABSH25_10345 [Syntrophorhabdales bacterium]